VYCKRCGKNINDEKQCSDCKCVDKFSNILILFIFVYAIARGIFKI
jgi:hypothetical protein